MQTLKPDTRKRILKVAKKLFLDKGYRDATTRDIARMSGVGLSNLYHYYASKGGMFTAYARNSEVWLKVKYSW